jgi:hypothetical protein
MTNAISYPKFKAWDHNGLLLAGGLLYSYEPNTSIQTNTYSDVDLTTPNDNPVVLDSVGEADVYLDGSVKLVLTDKDGTLIWTVDRVVGTTVGHKHSALWAPDGSPQAVWVDAAGNVGIGGAPDSSLLLKIIAGATGYSAIMFKNPATIGDGFQVGLDENQKSAYVWNGENVELYFGTNNVERMRITAAGLVGIGTGVPTSALQVIGLPSYADNAAASSAGLTIGAFYYTGDIVKVVHA